MRTMRATREKLPMRRGAIVFDFFAQKREHTISVTPYADGRPAEIFIRAAKRGSAVDADMHDFGVLLSFALQYGVPFEKLSEAIARDATGAPEGFVGELLDELQNNLGKAPL